MFQDKEEKGEEDEGQVNIIPKWKAGQTTGIHLASEDDDLEEVPAEPTTEQSMLTLYDLLFHSKKFPAFSVVN